MSRSSALITETELAVLQHLWHHGDSIVRDISQGIYGENKRRPSCDR